MAEVDESRLLADLVALADRYEQRARQLRQAASIVSDDLEAPVRDIAKASDVGTDPDIPGADFVAEVKSPRLRPVSRDDYMAVLWSDPDNDWDPYQLHEGMVARGHPHLKLEACRTMLYRLEKNRLMERSGRGSWRLSGTAKRPPNPSPNGNGNGQGSWDPPIQGGHPQEEAVGDRSQ